MRDAARVETFSDGVFAIAIERTAAAFYAGALLAVAVASNIAWGYAATRRRLIRPEVPEQELKGISKTFLLGPVIYGSAVLVALVSPWAAVAICATLALYAFPARALTGSKRR